MGGLLSRAARSARASGSSLDAVSCIEFQRPSLIQSATDVFFSRSSKIVRSLRKSIQRCSSCNVPFWSLSRANHLPNHSVRMSCIFSESDSVVPSRRMSLSMSKGMRSLPTSVLSQRAYLHSSLACSLFLLRVVCCLRFSVRFLPCIALRIAMASVDMSSRVGSEVSHKEGSRLVTARTVSLWSRSGSSR